MGTIYQSIEILSKEKGIDPQVVLDAVKDAMLVAARKHFRTTDNLVAEFEPRTGAIQIFVSKKVVENVEDPNAEMTLGEALAVDPKAELGSEIRIHKSTESLGRISAQTAKQVILQKVREAERESVFSEFSGRTGELVNCTVKRIESQDLVVDIGKTEARIPKKEQSKLESFSVGERLRCVIKSVEKAGKNAGVIVSRADPELVKRLFEQEVPEIYDNTVVIKGCAREAGERTKIAVFSRDRDVDSVGACVGMKGMRVQSIIRELRGEKIDIIEFSDDPVVFATHALSPAKISRVQVIDALDKHMEVIVDDTQLSLAIGKKGQNVRLAAKLLGWKIDIKSEEEKRQEVESAMAALTVQGTPISALLDHGLPEKLLEKLVEAGIPTVERVGEMTPEQIEEVQGIGPKGVERIFAAVNTFYGQYDEHPEAVAEPATTDDQPATAEQDVDGPAPEEAQPAEDTAGDAAAPGEEPPAPAPEAMSLTDEEPGDYLVELPQPASDAEPAEDDQTIEPQQQQ
ncbi:MAG: transcription termination factor NusA [Bryobacteraceae bacterium]|nr:transcription termination factor NusA [Bryobacteraceae bacterium]